MRLPLVLLLVLFTDSAKSQVAVSNSDTIVNLAYVAKYIEDPHGTLTITNIIQLKDSNAFNNVGKEVIGFGLTPSFFWIKSIVRNETNQKLFIKISNNSLTDIQLFEASGQRLSKQYHTGSWQAFHKRPVRSIDYLFPLEVERDSSAIVYIRVMHLRGTQFPLNAGTLKAFYVTDITRILTEGIYYGLMLLMILYNLFIYFSLRDTSYLFYVNYIFLITLLNASMDGYGFQHIWPWFPVLNPYEDILAALVGLAGILFVTRFLNTKFNTPFFYQIFKGLFIAYVITIVIIASGNFLIGSNILETITLVSVVCIFVAAYVTMKKGFKPAKFFLIAWTLLLISIIVFILKDYNLVQYNGITVNALKIGSGAEALLLSIALADRINLYREEKASAQQDLINSLQEKTAMQHDMLELEAKALRSQMNPHFIFNCMNSIKSLIQQQEKEKAVNYLTTFSKLLRTILQNADKRDITLYDEIEICKLYTQLESLRFGNKFTYNFDIDTQIDLKSIKVPALILQPYLENAVWHGIIPKQDGGNIGVCIEKKGNAIYCIIDDNGIGRVASMNTKSRHPPSTHQSKGVKLAQSRLDLDNALHNREAAVKTIDKTDEKDVPCGTTVILTFKEY